ncbi:lysine N(6)-hydroxylase/L-ornithine N(5)-oxygenase family protein [Kitasatospora cheerisanensis]|uniref:L-lysine N6-monooxygenase MbtG n=1 Tax=Kitasatospora cheerisanensis KCTC 2395 TaxID=1348663 RepID=A0A066Z196_9ACTN|nr:SidA/IucD/PvdA family monooxygenase [Kitasatospora cheerisanensis]KDN86019.1 putative L-ornithine 5-monooxygenase [Kitasatospora cheerisanensis KCTC 2395]
MADLEVGVLAIGAGPANLALAAAIEESGSAELAEGTLLLEQAPDIKWQRDLLMPWARSQVSFLKDLVTLRDPRSRFSFLNFLHQHGRLDQFINLGTFHPHRWEFSDYLQWVAASLEKVRIRYDAKVTATEPRYDADGKLVGWLVTLADGDTIRCRDLVVGAGRDMHIPAVFADLPAEKVIHSARFRSRISAVDKDAPLRTVVIGGAQSAAEMFMALYENLPNSTVTMLVRSIGLQNYQTSKFVNELFYPSFVDEFYDAPAETRAQLLDEMRFTNYAALAPPFLDELYMVLYREKMIGTGRAEVRAMTEVVAAREEDGEVVLDLRDRRTGKTVEQRCDLVLLGTGYDSRMPAMVRDLTEKAGLPEVTVSRDYRVDLGAGTDAALYLQGVNEATHGIADSLISVLAHRARDITGDLLARHGLDTAAAGAR